MIIVASIETPMYRTLLQLTPDEMREVTRLAGTSPSAAPEEIIRGLSRRTGAGAWGLFPASTEDVLLDQVGRRLGMAPLLGGPTAIPQRERQ
ncbi:MAG: hypothetical protein FJX77_09175, partial [Armatimonadetes bacterium]|nr:hypothetical protein [Armatimonadota bacterium]